jgi:hypothetical protein
MICPSCSAGADDASTASKPGIHKPIAEILRSQAVNRHAECKGGTWCDCQHRIPARKATGDATKPDTQA